MKVLQLLQCLLLIASAAYATASELQQTEQQQQKQLQQPAQHAEVASVLVKPKFGTKIPQNVTIEPKDVTLKPTVASTVGEIRTAPRVPRRYDAPIAPTAQQLVAQSVEDIPIVHKSHKAPASLTTNAKRGSGAPPARNRERSNATRQQQQPAGVRYSNSNAGNVARVTKTQSPNATVNNGSRSGSGGDRRRTANVESSRSGASRNGASGGKAKLRRQSTTTTTTTTTSTSTTTTTPLPAFNNAFNFFAPNFWSFSSPSKPPSTKKSPKKYINPSTVPPATLKARKQNAHKPKQTTTTSTSPPVLKKEPTDGPFRIALPTLAFRNSPAADKEKRNSQATLRERFNCPRENEVRFQLFPKICKIDKDCAVWERDEICCEIFGAKSCVSGIPKPLEETSHSPILGLIPRKCPTRPLAELWWEVQECETDMDCWPRVCCPDGRKRYCRTSQPELETAPVPVKRSFDYLSEYLECTPPPPPIFDLHPKTCGSTFDCFPNVCCQEAGQRHCRPPKKSVLTLMANFLNVDFVKRLTQNIVIK